MEFGFGQGIRGSFPGGEAGFSRWKKQQPNRWVYRLIRERSALHYSSTSPPKAVVPSAAAHSTSIS